MIPDDDIDEVADAFGRFTAEGVAYLASRRGCVLVGVEDFAAAIRKQDSLEAKPEFAVCVDVDRWRPAEVYRACTRARGEKVQSWEPPKDLRTSLILNESLIAELVASEGIRPYYKGDRTLALVSVLRTWTIGTIMFYDRKPVKLAALAVVDAGLADLKMGPRGGWATATLTWNDRGKLPTAEERAKLHASRRDADEFLR